VFHRRLEATEKRPRHSRGGKRGEISSTDSKRKEKREIPEGGMGKLKKGEKSTHRESGILNGGGFPENRTKRGL